MRSVVLENGIGSTQRSPNRTKVIWLAAWSLVVAAQIITPLWYPTPDSCAYLSIARSVAQSGHATKLGSPHLMVAPGYPYLLSVLYAFSEKPFLEATLMNALLAGVYVAGTYSWVRRYAPEAALLVAFLAVGNTIVLGILRRTLSEALFLPLMIWLVNAMAAIRPDQRGNKVGMLSASALLVMLVVVRLAGIVFAAGFGLQMALMAVRHQISWWRAAALTSILVSPAVLAMAVVIAIDQRSANRVETSNLDIFARRTPDQPRDYPDLTITAQLLEGTRIRLSEIGRLLIPGMFNSYSAYGRWFNLNMALYATLAALALLGWIRMLRLRADAFVLALPFYVGLYIYWPFNQSARYFAPLISVFLLCCWYGLESVGRQRILGLKVLLVLHLIPALGYWLAVDRPRALAVNRRWDDARRVANKIQSAPGEIEASRTIQSFALVLQYELDRPVRLLNNNQAPGTDAEWLLAASKQLIGAEFTPRARFASFCLLQRVHCPSPAVHRQILEPRRVIYSFLPSAWIDKLK